MKKQAWVLGVYGLFLIAGALVAISISGWDRSKTALFSSSGAAFLVWGAAFASTRSGVFGKLGGVAALVLPLLFAATFFWRLTLNWAKPMEDAWVAANPGATVNTALIQSPLQNWLFPVFIAGSVLAFVGVLVTRRDSAAVGQSVTA